MHQGPSTVILAQSVPQQPMQAMQAGMQRPQSLSSLLSLPQETAPRWAFWKAREGLSILLAIRAPSPLADPRGKKEETMCQTSCFLGGYKGKELRHLLSDCGQETQAASPALPLTHCDLGPAAPPLGLLTPNCGQGRSEPVLAARTVISPLGGHKKGAEFLVGHTVECRGPPHLGRGQWGCGERA